MIFRDLRTGKFAKPKIKLNPKPTEGSEKQKRVALILGGAGAKILIETGVAKAIRDLGIEPACIIGTSSGAITAAFHAAGQLDDLNELCLTLKNKDVYKWEPWLMFTRKACLLSNTPLRQTLTKVLNCQKVRDFKKPVIANITDITNWSCLEPDLSTQDDKTMIDTIIKSTAVPVAFPIEDGCIDGGCVRNYPIIDALGQQVDEIILVVTAVVEPKPVQNIFDIIGQFISIVLYNQLTEAKKLLELVYIQNPDMRLAKLIVIQPDKPTNIGLLNIDKIGNREQRQAYIDEGYNLAMDVLTKAGYKKKDS